MMEKIIKLLHLRGLRRSVNLFLVNRVYAGCKERHFKIKRKLLNKIGYSIGEGTCIVGPFLCTGSVTIGKDCWIGKNFMVNGNGSVVIGDRCDIGPEVIFQTGGHQIGGKDRRAGEGIVCDQTVGSGTWIGGRSTIVNSVAIGSGCVIAACACVTKDVEDDTLAGGVPARVIRRLTDEPERVSEKSDR